MICRSSIMASASISLFRYGSWFTTYGCPSALSTFSSTPCAINCTPSLSSCPLQSGRFFVASCRNCNALSPGTSTRLLHHHSGSFLRIFCSLTRQAYGHMRPKARQKAEQLCLTLLEWVSYEACIPNFVTDQLIFLRLCTIQSTASWPGSPHHLSPIHAHDHCI